MNKSEVNAFMANTRELTISTVAEATALTFPNDGGDFWVRIEERGGAKFKTSATGSGNGYDSLVRDDGGYLELDEQGVVDVRAVGAAETAPATFNRDAINAVVSLPSVAEVVISESLNVSLQDTVSGDGLSYDAITVPSGKTFRFVGGGKLRLPPNDKDRHAVLGIYQGVSDVTIIDPCIIGDKDTHLTGTGQWGHGINIVGDVTTKNIKIIRPRVTKMWGDGIYLNGFLGVEIHQPKLPDNRRQGISLVKGETLRVYGGTASDTGPQNPSAGMDIEPNFNTDYLKDIKIYNMTFDNNGQGASFSSGLVISLSRLKDATPVGNNVEISVYNPIITNSSLTIGARVGAVGYINIHSPVVINSEYSGLYILNMDSATLKTTIYEPDIVNPLSLQRVSIFDNPITLEMTPSVETDLTGMRNVEIIRPKITYNRGLTKNCGIRLINATGIPNCFRDCVIDDPVVQGNVDSVFQAGGGGLPALFDSSFYINCPKRSEKTVLSEGTNIDNNYNKTYAVYTGSPAGVGTIYINSTLIAAPDALLCIENNHGNGNSLELRFGTSASPASRSIKGVTAALVAGFSIPWGGVIEMSRESNNVFKIIRRNCDITPL